MKNLLDSATIEVPCPHCAHKISKTVRQLKTVDKLTCSRCATVSHLDKAHMAREIASLERQVKAQIDQAAAKLKRALDRLGK